MRNSDAFSMIKWTFIAFALLGCTLPKPQEREDVSAASFYVENNEAKVTEQRTIKGFSIPAAKTFHFKVCVRDRKQSKAVLNHEFSISGDGKDVQKTTDASGCLNWDEEIVYNHFAAAQFVNVERVVAARGIQKGSRTIKWAINPWESKAFDQEKTEVKNLVVTENVMAHMMSSQNNEKSIVLTDMQITVVEKVNSEKEGLTVELELRGQPMLETRKSSQEITNEPLTEGAYKVKTHLIKTQVEGTQENRQTVFSSAELSVSSSRGFIGFKVPARIADLCTKGQYSLGLEVTADLPAPYKVKKFEGLYYIANCDQFRGSFFTRLSPEALKAGTEFSLESFVKQKPDFKAAEGLTSGVAPAKGQQTAGYSFAPLTAVLVNNKDTQPLERKITFNMSTAVISKYDRQIPLGYRFEITKLNGSKHEVELLAADGILRWEDSVNFNYLERECELSSQITIKNDALKINEVIPVLVNPWASQVRDMNANKELKAQKPRCAPANSSVVLGMLAFKKSRFSYGIDEFLNLTVKKTGIGYLPLRIKRPTLATDGSGIETIPAPLGKYLVRYAMIKNEANIHALYPEQIIMVREQVVDLTIPGEVIPMMTFESAQLKEIGSALQVLVMVTPSKSSANFENSIFVGNFIMSDNDEEVALTLMNNIDGNNVMTNLKNALTAQNKRVQESQKVLANKETLKKTLNLIVADLNTATSPVPIDNAVLKATLNQGSLSSAVADKLCGFWFENVLARGILSDRRMRILSEISACRSQVRASPSKYFDTQIRSFVKNPTLLDYAADNRDLTISSAFSQGRTQGHSDTQSRGWDAGVQLSTPYPILSASGGYRLSSTVADSLASSVGNQLSSSTSRSLTIEIIAMNFRIESSEKCMIIKMKPEIFMDKRFGAVFNPKLNANEVQSLIGSGLALCEGSFDGKPKQLTETFYIINQKVGSANTYDVHSTKNRPFFASVRGESDFVNFLSSINKDMSIPESFKEDFQNREFLKDRSKAFFLRGMPGSPGQVIQSK